MKKLVFVVALALAFAACQKDEGFVDQPVLKKGQKSQAVIDFNGPHFELNLVAKKDNWNENEFDNPSRHTIFVPRNTADWNIELKQPNNLDQASLPGVRIDMTQGNEFAVLDGTVFDGDKAEFQLGPGKYAVYVVARGKKNVDPAEITAWLEALQITDYTLDPDEELWIYENIGSVTVTRKWTNITDLFTVSASELDYLPAPTEDNQWVFDYLEWLSTYEVCADMDGDGELDCTTWSELAYFWQLVNNGSQLIKVRFYPLED